MKQVWEMTKAELRDEMTTRLASKGQSIIYGGPSSKTELENEVAQLREEQS